MPYITQEARARIDGGACPKNAGELNYLFTVIADWYCKENGDRYQQHNDVVGALECCKLERYRRRTAFYEDQKIAENGDVY